MDLICTLVIRFFPQQKFKPAIMNNLKTFNWLEIILKLFVAKKGSGHYGNKL